ncbi:AraC family transcriptional regulator [Bradyrhizobium barranii subsp. barranii]|uniref:AraC family transcriptional regulator n=1 Tax=Bradyrhizobium barranii subsp. barranii TaxID=2823807 RepID=A0A9X9YUI7_9BRAD|nr:AraC family transcriptional regulator [Bradyrhizobium barranii]UGX94592.1 AraC family transcriptional regulator [Bradyrhizobium barranii subsp. barranii]
MSALLVQDHFRRQSLNVPMASRSPSPPLSGYLGYKFGYVAVFVLAAVFGAIVIACVLMIRAKAIDDRASRGCNENAPDRAPDAFTMLLKHRALLVLALFHLGTPGCGTRSRSQRVIASGLSRNPALLRLRSTGLTIQPAVIRQLICPSRSMIQPQLSFDGDPNGQAYERWREQFCRQVADVDFVPIGEGRVHRTISPAILPRLRLSASFGTPMSFVSLGTNDELVITMSPNSALSGAMGRRPLEVAAGDVTIGDPSIKGAHITQTTHGNFQTALLPRKALLRACPNAEDLIAQSIPGANPITSMFLRYYDLAHTYADKLAPAELDAVSQHLFDLSVLMIGARGDVAEQARMRGLAAARLETLKSDILAQLDNPALSLTVLSAAHRISPRTIQLMFEQAGITYSGFVLEQRLLRAERLLRNPNLRARKIIEIAHLAGFHDVSYFHRAFRRRFGRTPDDVRKLSGEMG